MNRKLSIAVVLCAAAGGFSVAQAQVMCGDTIINKEVLTSDLNCSGFDPALTIRGPNGLLAMKGFTLSCEGSLATGIQMTNTGPRLLNGTVANCNNGVVLDGARAQVSRMILRDNENAGLQIDSGSGHRVSDTTATNNNGRGFRSGGDNSFFNRNRATNNSDDGFETSSNDRYTRNVATGNGGNGFQVSSGDTLSRNTSNQNDADGFLVAGDNNTLTGNIARSNFGDGIDALVEFGQGASNNTLSGNNASGNGSADTDGDGGFDLEDDNTNCDNNTWTNNTGTRNQTCIQ